MEPKNMLELVVGIAVGVLVLSAALFPVIDDATTTERTFTNIGYYSMDKVDDTANIEISWDHTNPNILTIDDKTLDMSFATSGLAYTIVGGDDLAVRFVKSGTTTFIQGLGSTYFNGGANQNITITVANGEVICKSDRADIPDYTVTYTFDDNVYVANPSGTGNYSFVMKDSTKPAYINGDSIMTFVGVTNLDPNKLVGIYGVGTLDDGMELSTIMAQGTTVTAYSDPVATYSAVNGYKDLYSLEKYEFTISYDTSSTYDATYSYFIIPASVTAELAVHASQDEIDLLETIPILIIVGLIMGIVGLIASRRFE